MTERLLESQLEPILRRERSRRRVRALAGCWAATAILGLALLLLQSATGWASPATLPILATLGLIAAIVMWTRARRGGPDLRWVAAQVEQRHPELHALLLTAVQQRADDGGSLTYLQQRLLQEAVAHARRHDWRDAIPTSKLAWTHAAHLAALALCAVVLWQLRVAVIRGAPIWVSHTSIAVTPGDTRLERGNSLVVLARFEGPLPADATLVVRPANEASRTIPLVKSLSDPIFGGSVPDVAADLLYHVEYGGQRTRDFKATVYEHPRLERADAQLTYPAYTAQAPKRIEDTRRLSAVEGTRLELALQFNKPVASARLIAKDKEKATLSLLVATNRPAATLKDFALTASKTYELQLVDAEGLTNKAPVQFVIEVLPNRAPELRLASPRGDLRPSALEEIPFEGTVWDDFGVVAYGLAYTRAGQEPTVLELGRTVPAKEKRTFRHLLRLEDLAVQPDQFLSWFVWADDIGPDGQVRRTSGDLFFAEVRPFEEIFREGQAADSPSQEQEASEPSDQQGNPTGRIAELQKQIINATWKLQREHSRAASPQYAQDAPVVRDSQAQALAQTETAKERAQDPRVTVLWNTVVKAMEQALQRLNEATNSPAPLPQALTAEQSAYQALLKLQQREFEVSRSRSRSRNQQGNSREQQMQRQLDQLDLTQSENRYETQRQARPAQSAERREQLQVLNRLQELARRQQDLNERLKELQTALQEARTEPEREEIRRRLKRLQEEEQQMLADVDEVRQRMDRPENQSRMAEERRQLEQTRSEVQRAAEAAGQGATAQALAAGTRAQRQLQELRDEMRKESSSQFAEDLRQMRADARELARQQEDVGRKLDGLAEPKRKTLSDATERKEVLDQLTQQKQRVTNLVERATQVSQQADTAEPLLSRQLYDTLRQFNQEDVRSVKEAQEELVRRGLLGRSLYDRLRETSEQEGAKSLEVTAEMLRQGYLPLADTAEARARAGIDDLKRGVERAAESVIGDDAEALRLARQELDTLTQQVMREMAGGPGTNSANGSAAPGGATNAPATAAGARDANNRQAQAGNPAQRGDPAAAERGQAQPGSAPGSTAEGASGQGAQTPAAGQQQASAQNGRPAERASGQPGQEGRGAAAANAADRPEAQRGADRGGRQGQSLRDTAQRDGRTRDNRAGSADPANDTGGRGGPYLSEFDRILNDDGLGQAGPITGDNFGPWADRLRDVEEMIELPDLRNEVAAARERARRLRVDFKTNRQKPDWAVVRLQVVKPLVEVRDRLAEELARRESREALVPIDRDPVPNRYSELVRRYYEELGKDK